MNKIEKLLDKIEAAHKEIKATEYKSALILYCQKLKNRKPDPYS